MLRGVREERKSCQLDTCLAGVICLVGCNMPIGVWGVTCLVGCNMPSGVLHA